ncbi:MAG TPA: hypothetical protein VFU59_04860, partial [Candidatus Eisenbacteria bacterium]|nr:hypothetical protein [Candidatus Eisenbacteria bacterium]
VHGAVLFVGYLAIEPYVRRLWPSVLVSWARLVSGRVRDPIIGRDILAGSALALFGVLVDRFIQYVARSTGLTDQAPSLFPSTLMSMFSSSSMLSMFTVSMAIGLLRAMVFFTLLVILRFVLRNNRAAAVAIVIVFSLVFTNYGSKAIWLELPMAFILNTLSLVIVLRFGFVATAMALGAQTLFSEFPWTTNFSTWSAPQTLLGWILVLGLVGYGFMTAVGGKSLFKDPLSDPLKHEVR